MSPRINIHRLTSFAHTFMYICDRRRKPDSKKGVVQSGQCLTNWPVNDPIDPTDWIVVTDTEVGDTFGVWSMLFYLLLSSPVPRYFKIGSLPIITKRQWKSLMDKSNRFANRTVFLYWCHPLRCVLVKPGGIPQLFTVVRLFIFTRLTRFTIGLRQWVGIVSFDHVNFVVRKNYIYFTFEDVLRWMMMRRIRYWQKRYRDIGDVNATKQTVTPTWANFCNET